jgi:hypothetical protein
VLTCDLNKLCPIEESYQLSDSDITGILPVLQISRTALA